MIQRTHPRTRRGAVLILALVAIPLVTAAAAVLIANGADMRRDTEEALASAVVRQMLAGGQAWVRRQSGGSPGDSQTLPVEVPEGFTGKLTVTWQKGPEGDLQTAVTADVRSSAVHRRATCKGTAAAPPDESSDQAAR